MIEELFEILPKRIQKKIEKARESDLEKAIKLLDSLLPYDDDAFYVANIYDEKAAAYIKADDEARAEIQFNEALDVLQGTEYSSMLAIIYFKRANLYIRQKQYLSAADDLEEAEGLGIRGEMVHGLKAECYLHLESWEAAGYELSKAIKFNKRHKQENATYYYGRAIANINLERNGAALSDISKAVEIEDDNAEYHTMKGSLLLLFQRPKEAIICLTRAIDLGALELGDVYYNRSIAYMALDKTKEAEQDFACAKKLSPHKYDETVKVS